MGGHRFGELAKVRGITTFKISPFEQRAFAKAIVHGVPNTLRRIIHSAPRVGPPFLIGYMVFSLAEKRYKKLIRKNPGDYEDDK